MKRIIAIFLLFTTFLIASEERETIAIFTYKAEGVPSNYTWDPDSIQSGITGSEEAVIYLSNELAKLGYLVVVFGYPPKNSPYSHPRENPRYLSVDEFSLNDVFDIAICWRMPALGKDLKKHANRVYLWPHDRRWPVRLTKEQIDSFNEVLWVSKWQRGQWIENNKEFAQFHAVCGNGIDKKQFSLKGKKKNPYSCIYGSNYGQGLSVLLDIWPRVKETYPKATLDIYYGWNHFGFLSQEKELKMRKQIVDLEKLGVKEHGMVGHKELHEAYSRSAFWTYPCTGTETFSITALKAQMAGAIPVVIMGSALFETVGFGYNCETEDAYLDMLLSAMGKSEKEHMHKRQDMRGFVEKNHTWEEVAKRWQRVFEESKVVR